MILEFLDQMQISPGFLTIQSIANNPSVYNNCSTLSRIFPRFSLFLRREKTSETICNQLILISMAILNIEQVDSNLVDLQVRAISLSTAIFMHNPSLRKDILAEAIALALATRKWNTKYIRNFPLVANPAIATAPARKQKIKRSNSIQMHTALILQLLQCVFAANLDSCQSSLLNSLLPQELLTMTVEEIEQVSSFFDKFLIE